MTRCMKCLRPADLDVNHGGDVVGPMCLPCADLLMFRLAEETGEWGGYEKWKRHMREVLA